MPLDNPVGSVCAAIDRYVGLSDMAPAQRRRAMAAQVSAALNLVPVTAAAAVPAAALLLFSAWGNARFSIVAGLLTVFVLLQLAVTRLWWRRRHVREAEPGLRGAVRQLCAIATLLGLNWGVLLAVMVPTTDTQMLVIVAAILTAGMLIVGFVFAAMAQAMLSFIAASGIAALTGLALQPVDQTIGSTMALVVFYLVFMPWVGLQMARVFMAGIGGEVRQKEIADLNHRLLSGYEETASEWFWETDESGRTVRVSPRLRQRLSLPSDAGVPLFRLLSQAAVPGDTGIDAIRAAMNERKPFHGAEVAVSVAGEVRWWRVSGKPTSIDSHGAPGFVGTVSDVTAEKATESKIIQLAHRDTLTGLYNRASFTERLEASVRMLERYGTPFSLLFLDLDKFKLVNDTYGHPIGDKLLLEVANRVLEAVRSEDCVARLGGDEFAIIIERSNDAVFAAKLASRLIARVLEPYHIEGETLWIGVSVGIALAPQHGTRPEQILRNADLALYRAKEDGRGVFRYFEAQMDFAQRERRILEQEMHQALEEEEFRLCYQPMISADSGYICCMEALIRWDHPIRGEISPGEFISIAEQSNLIVEIGKWTLLTACRAAADWPDNVCVSVNVAATHFMRSDIVADVAAVLEATGLDGRRLEIEITEGLLIEDSEDVINRLAALKRLGCAIVMDDFGTGYSSLSYLLKFPFDRLKIDQSFIADIGRGASARAILMAIASLGENLGIKITAEGVETREQLSFLQDIACDQLQGYLFSQPVPHADVAPMMLRNFIDTSALVALPQDETARTRSTG